MKILLFAGLLLLVLGVASLLVPIPHTDTTHSQRVSPAISAVLIAGGLALSIASARSRS